MTGLPAWVDELAGFDAAGWWRAIVCTGRNQHRPELLGVVFEHSNGNGLHYAGPHIHHERVPLTSEQQGQHAAYLAQRERDRDTGRPSLARPVTATRGSLNFECPSCRRTPRVPRAQWSTILESARRVDPIDLPWVDLSLLT